MNAPQNIQEAYYGIIKSLYGDTIIFSPNDVNEDVVKIVDTMLDQITKCHNRVKPIALIFEALAIFIKSKYPPEIEFLVGSKSWEKYMTDGDGLNAMINMAKVLHIGGFIDEMPDATKLFQDFYDDKNLFLVFRDFYKVYMEYNRKDRRLAMCINTTKLHWRSPLQLALMNY